MTDFARSTVALVTGAASGIGAATVRMLVERGVGGFALIDRNDEALRELEAALSHSGVRVLALAQDVIDEAAWRTCAQRITEELGRLDFVVASAGVADGAPLADMSFEAWRRVVSINLDGVFLTLKYGLPLIATGERGGAAVVVSSAAALKAEPGVGAYAASKAAVVQLAKVAAKEHAADRIRVNAVLPGGVETPIWRSLPFFADLVAKLGSEAAALASMGEQMPLGRYAKAEEIAVHIAHLLSDAAGPITGASLVVDGGYSL